jgi:hypothetical protein
MEEFGLSDITAMDEVEATIVPHDATEEENEVFQDAVEDLQDVDNNEVVQDHQNVSIAPRVSTRVSHPPVRWGYQRF